jgi:transposase
MLVCVGKTALTEAVRKKTMETTAQVLKEHITYTPESIAKLIRQVRRKKTRREFSAEDKLRIVLEGSRKLVPFCEYCRRKGINPTLYYSWLKDFMVVWEDRRKGGRSLNSNAKTVGHVFDVLHEGSDVRKIIRSE